MMFSKHLLVLKLIWVGVTTSTFRAPLHTKEGRKAWTLASVPPEKSKALKKQNYKKKERQKSPNFLNIRICCEILCYFCCSQQNYIKLRLNSHTTLSSILYQENETVFSPFRRHRQNPTGVGQHHHWAVTCCDGFATLRWATAPILRW